MAVICTAINSMHRLAPMLTEPTAAVPYTIWLMKKVMGTLSSLNAPRVTLVLTSDMLYTKLSRAPLMTLDTINGMTILPNVTVRVAPRLSDASSRLLSICCNPAYTDLVVKGSLLIV